MDSSLIEKFAAIVGEKNALREISDTAPFVADTRGRYDTTTPLVLRPNSVEEVSSILKLASETGTAIVPQGGNSGLVGGGLPLEGHDNSIILSLSRMNRILDVDAASNTMLVEAGAVLETIQNAADAADRLFPLSLGSQGSCQIGGNISSNAGGTGVLAYGNTRDLVMGLEVVLPTGEILNSLSRLRKDNTGYDLRNLFIGGEGTLGIVTKAVLKLFPKPAGTVVAYVGLDTPEAALVLLNLAKENAGAGLTGFEFINETSMEIALQFATDAQPPLSQSYAWSVLIEVSSGRSQEDATASLESILGSALEDGTIKDATIAQSSAQQQAFWKLREDMSPAQKPHGASIKHDISVPVGRVPDFIKQADPAVLSIVPEARIVNFGHMGDGNLHYNISQPIGWAADAFFAHEDAIHTAIYNIVGEMDGSISAEHGIGQMKREKLAAVKDPVAFALMKRLKRELDPAGIMNPGKIFTDTTKGN